MSGSTRKSSDTEGKLPQYRDTCYACSGKAVGVRDRRPEGGSLESACARHADPTLRSYPACWMCMGTRPSLVVEGEFLHKSCHDAACRGAE